MHLAAVIVFWTCSALLVYLYLLYPPLVRGLARAFGRPVARGDALPTVTVIVTAYNEEKSIRAKLDNLARLDYPAERLAVLVVSDASSDRTEELVRAYDPRHVSVLRVEGRKGKTACQNAAAAIATGEALIFTDATTELDRVAARRLVANLADPGVGCVAGRLVYVTRADNVTGRNSEAYWDYELRLRAAESAFDSLIGASGCLYAVRRSAYRPIDPGLISDFVIAMRMREQGLRTVLESEAICYEDTLGAGSHELAMRVRVALRSLNALVRERRFLNPLRYGRFAWQLCSHKLLRYASPLLWLAALGANLALASEPGYVLLLIAQLAVIGAGLIGFALQARRPRLGIFGRPYYLLLTNLASLIATLRYLRGERMVTWTPIR
jgi:cellulose synthase/poly-beta-1,6-N-acetylglucosamine synthase-like glycosyltransferase